MASNKKAKRFLSDDSDDEPPLSTYSPPFSPFLIIKSNDENQSICKLSPFIIEKQIQSILGTPKSVKKLRNETLLVECRTRQQSENLCKITSFFNIKVSVSPHISLNSSKGIIRNRDLGFCTDEEEIKLNLKDQGVIDVH